MVEAEGVEPSSEDIFITDTTSVVYDRCRIEIFIDKVFQFLVPEMSIY